MEELVGLDNFFVRECVLAHNDTEIATFPTAIAEVARLREQIFVVLSVPDGSDDVEYMGTNLWSVSLDGKLLWKAPNLNENSLLESRRYPLHYRGLSIFDLNDPKLRAYADDRWYPTLDPATGKFIQVYPDVDWNDYDRAYDTINTVENAIRAATFVRARAISIRPSDGLQL